MMDIWLVEPLLESVGLCGYLEFSQLGLTMVRKGSVDAPWLTLINAGHAFLGCLPKFV